MCASFLFTLLLFSTSISFFFLFFFIHNFSFLPILCIFHFQLVGSLRRRHFVGFGFVILDGVAVVIVGCAYVIFVYFHLYFTLRVLSFLSRISSRFVVSFIWFHF